MALGRCTGRRHRTESQKITIAREVDEVVQDSVPDGLEGGIDEMHDKDLHDADPELEDDKAEEGLDKYATDGQDIGHGGRCWE